MEDEVPFEVIDFPETGNLSGQTGGDVIEPARSIRFRIENVEPRTFKKEGFLMTAKLNVRCAVGPLGVDGNGKYAGKNLFAELLTWFNEAVYTSEWWRKQSRFPYSRFLKALGFDISNPPKINDDFWRIRNVKTKCFQKAGVWETRLFSPPF